MIFSKEKWNDAEAIRNYISVSVALDFGRVKGPLLNAFDMFIYPLIGENLSIRLISIYKDGNITELDLKFLNLSQRANALLAFWYNFNELQYFIGSNGAKRAESENTKGLYKYQEKDLVDGWKSKGFKALDDLLRFLEENITEYPEYKESDAYTESLSSIIRNTSEVNDYYEINHSRLIFLRLRSHFRVVENTIIEPRLGSDLYDEFKAQLQNVTPDGKYTKLREKLIPVVVFYAVCRLIRETGSLTDRGLFFSSLKGDDSTQTNVPVSDERLTMQADKAESDAISYWLLVEKYLKSAFKIVSSGGTRIPNRDNNDKKSFWT